LRNGFEWFADIFRICNRTIQLADATKLEETIHGGVQFYEADMRARGIPTS
jgi:hypothetical protein